MGLYLCVFDSAESDDDLDGIELGSYDDFDRFRGKIHRLLEPGVAWGSRFPVLLQHSDSDGEWTVDELRALDAELAAIRVALAEFDPPPYSGWQAEAAEHARHRPANHGEFFIDVDGEMLLDRMAGLVRLAIDVGRPITFM